MSISADDERLVYMPESDVLAAGGMVDAMRNCWFSTHPERGLMFWQSSKRRQGKLTGASPQCNRHESTARLLSAKMYPWAEVKFFPLVLAPIDLSDYQD